MLFASLRKLMNRLTRGLVGDCNAGKLPCRMRRPRPSDGADDSYGSLQVTSNLQPTLPKSH